MEQLSKEEFEIRRDKIYSEISKLEEELKKCRREQKHDYRVDFLRDEINYYSRIADNNLSKKEYFFNLRAQYSYKKSEMAELLSISDEEFERKLEEKIKYIEEDIKEYENEAGEFQVYSYADIEKEKEKYKMIRKLRERYNKDNENKESKEFPYGKRETYMKLLLSDEEFRAVTNLEFETAFKGESIAKGIRNDIIEQNKSFEQEMIEEEIKGKRKELQELIRLFSPKKSILQQKEEELLSLEEEEKKISETESLIKNESKEREKDTEN